MKRVIAALCALASLSGAVAVQAGDPKTPLVAMPGKIANDGAATAYATANKLVLKSILTPATARFSILGQDEESTIESLAPGAWEASGFVDAQNVFGALVRSEWRVIWRAEGEKPQVLFLKLGNDTKGNAVAARRAALPAAEREAIEAQEKRQAEERETAEKKRAEEMAATEAEQLRARAAIIRRENFRQAREFVVNWAKQPPSIRHSILAESDDQFTACHLLGNDVWEARGVADTGTNGKPARSNWRVLFWVKEDGNTQAGFWEFGNRNDGELDGTLRRAGIEVERKKKSG